MNAVEKLKQDLNPDLFVDMVSSRPRRKRADVIPLPVEQKEDKPEKPDKSDPGLFASCILAAFGLWCLVLACLV